MMRLILKESLLKRYVYDDIGLYAQNIDTILITVVLTEKKIFN